MSVRTFYQGTRILHAKGGGAIPEVSFRTIELVPENNAHLIAPRATGLTIIPTFDTTITSLPNAAAIEAAINAAITEVTSLITDNITITILFKDDPTISLGRSLSWFETLQYTEIYYPALQAKTLSPSTTPDQVAGFASLSNTIQTPLPQTDLLTCTFPFLRLYGQTAVPPDGYDSIVSLNTAICNFTRTSIDPSKYDLQSVAQHEIDEVLGTSSELPTPLVFPPTVTGNAAPADLFRYAAAHTRSFNPSTSGIGYFSIDSGVTNIASYNNSNAGEDYGDWRSPNQSPTEPIRVQNAAAEPGGWVDLINPYGTPVNPWIANPPAGTGGIILGKSPELRVLNVIGWTLANPLPCIHKDMLVETRSGIKKMSEVVIGDEVKTINDEFIPIVYNIIMEDTNEFYKFKKGCLNKNSPNQDFYIHGGHPFLYKGEMTLPSDLVGKVEGVEEVKLDHNVRIYSLCTKNKTVFNVSNMLVYTWAEEEWLECAVKYRYLYNTQ